jgi:hypothetical protein
MESQGRFNEPPVKLQRMTRIASWEGDFGNDIIANAKSASGQISDLPLKSIEVCVGRLRIIRH